MFIWPKFCHIVINPTERTLKIVFFSGTVLLGSNSQVCNLVFGLTALVTQVQLPDLAQESMKVN